MEAGAENNVEILVLDRPNPHDGYIDGPVFKEEMGKFCRDARSSCSLWFNDWRIRKKWSTEKNG